MPSHARSVRPEVTRTVRVVDLGARGRHPSKKIIGQNLGDSAEFGIRAKLSESCSAGAETGLDSIAYEAPSTPHGAANRRIGGC